MRKQITLHYTETFLHRDSRAIGRVRRITISYEDRLEVIVHDGRVYATLQGGRYEKLLAPVQETLEEIMQNTDVDVTYYNKEVEK